MSRYFVSITLPSDIQKQLDEIVPENRVWRKSKCSHLHITLRYIGDTDAAAIEQIESKLAKIEIPEFTLRLREIGFFPEQGKVRVIWFGAEKSSTLMALQSLADMHVSEIIKSESEHSFTPHVTLARVKSGVKREIAQSLIPEIDKVIECRIKSFQLMESRQGIDGLEHIPLANYQLKKNG